VSQCAEILLELKTKTDIIDINMQLQLPKEDTAIYTGIKEAARTQIF
jgi:hypothetical protein